jgi:DNA recombination protein RmuC
METLVVGMALVAVVVAAGVWVVAVVRRSVEGRLGTTDAELRRLGDAGLWRERGAEDMRREITGFRTALDDFRVREQERRVREEEGWATLHRVAAVLAGGGKAGRAGENVLRESLAHLPPSMIQTDFRVNGRVVEFALVLPDGRRLPIDSKWPAQRELVALAGATNSVERERLVKLVERTVTERAREVCGYRDPAVTASVGVAAVPDAAYAVLRKAHADAYRQGVIVVPYSMALPVLLFLYSIVSRFGAAGDVESCLGDLATALDAMEGTLENKVVRASTMLANGADEFRAQMGRARASLSRAREPNGQGAASTAEPERPHLVGLSP